MRALPMELMQQSPGEPKLLTWYEQCFANSITLRIASKEFHCKEVLHVVPSFCFHYHTVRQQLLPISFMDEKTPP